MYKLTSCLAIASYITFPALAADSVPITQAFSGLETISSTEYFAVYDEKHTLGNDPDTEPPRFSVIVNNGEGQLMVNDIDNSKVDYGNQLPANDLEGICRLSDNHYVALESSYYQGNYGRLLVLDYTPANQQQTITIKAAIDLPTQDGLNFEGIACEESIVGESYNIMIGDRNSGQLWLSKILKEQFDYGVLAPFHQVTTVDTSSLNGSINRPISELHSLNGKIYGFATFDDGDPASFRSVLYQLDIDLTDESQITNLPPTVVSEQIITTEGNKMEGLTALSSTLLLGSSDNDGTSNLLNSYPIED
ncbi:hypothetical protein J4N42_15470 [Vibrio sp. SCSIO 43135]|uniref:hypothetical protein n=1 Tax=Vibrio sp. SCSIO 43135 TaxID=2819096 RepID=UPI002074F315|nr:hypothetical protein [Vibrio sp. SCSIO 43135]USD43575.1 hypothetical protein J4N42_15470 [Vibrio sp. SCSIO 43135]